MEKPENKTCSNCNRKNETKFKQCETCRANKLKYSTKRNENLQKKELAEFMKNQKKLKMCKDCRDRNIKYRINKFGPNICVKCLKKKPDADFLKGDRICRLCISCRTQPN